MQQAAQDVGAGTVATVTGVAFKSAPPVAVSGLTLYGIPLSDWVYIATLVWLVMQAGFFLYDRVQGKRGGRRKGDAR